MGKKPEFDPWVIVFHVLGWITAAFVIALLKAEGIL